MINAFEAMKRSEEIPVRPEKKKIVFQALSSQICLLDGWKKVKHVSQNGDSPLSHETEHEIKRWTWHFSTWAPFFFDPQNPTSVNESLNLLFSEKKTL